MPRWKCWWAICAASCCQLPIRSAAHQQLARYHGLLDAFVRDWRQAYVQYGEDPAGRHHFAHLRDALRTASRPASEGIVLRTNRVAAHQVLEGRVLRVCVAAIEPNANVGVQRVARASSAGNNLTRPVFIMAAPRSGSSLLFETLGSSDQIVSLGGEAHWLIETIAELAPGRAGRRLESFVGGAGDAADH